MSPCFKVSDKVVLKPYWAGMACTVPKLVPGRVYCVEKVNSVRNNWWVRLVGVREHRIKCCDDRGVSTLFLAQVGRAGTAAGRKEEA